MLCSAFRKFYGRCNDLICPYNLALGHMLFDMFHTNREAVLDTLILTTGRTVYLIWKCGSRRVWPVSRGCLLLHGTWSHLWCIQRSVYAHFMNCISYRTYEIDYCSLLLSFLEHVAPVLRTTTADSAGRSQIPTLPVSVSTRTRPTQSDTPCPRSTAPVITKPCVTWRTTTLRVMAGPMTSALPTTRGWRCLGSRSSSCHLHQVIPPRDGCYWSTARCVW
jgi:hypothetical protein